MNLKIAGPITLALVYRSYSHSSLTLPGILVATLTAIIHAAHPSPLPFTLLVTFFLLGTTATKVKKDVKASLTLSSTGHRTFGSSSRVQDWFGSGWNKHKPVKATTAQQPGDAKQVVPTPKPTGGQEPRSATQVVANSVWSTLLCLLHLYIVGSGTASNNEPSCFGKGLTAGSRVQDLILVGIISNYAAVTADTLSSELGILSSVRPRHILTFREVPPGTNGGITGAGLFSGLTGALFIGLVSVLTMPDIWNYTYCLSLSYQSALDAAAATALATGVEAEIEIDPFERAAELFALILAVGSWGALGSVLDSILGACLQASVVDRRSGKVVEATNGGRVLISSGISSSSSETSTSATSTGRRKQKGGNDTEVEKVESSRILGSGRDILDNNQVNFLMAGVMTLGGVAIVGRAWEVDVLGLLSRGIGVGVEASK